ncbi:polysaccharide biosynthesis C-terminal domain-containing protein [Sporolactobacillus vineae]|uniref:oligosaccharide flippase family protein n=1 Tax=Sporolactobacillus vineae TaxID=444463 RepID=UPI00028984A2|nr:polysaccharide biosynthesis C-terminal domain-containing protein [Sporolactobacillus vineae]
MNRYKKLAFNSAIFAVGNLGSKLITLFLVPLYTYYLTVRQFGTTDLITTTLSLLIPIFTLSISDGVLRFVMDKSYDRRMILNNAIMITIFGYSIAWIFYPLFKVVFPFRNYLIYFYVMLFTSSLNGSLMQFIRANGRVKTFASVGVVSSLVILISNFLFLIIFHMGVSGYLLSLIVSDIISIIILLSIGGAQKYLSVSKIDFFILKDMLAFSIPLIPNALMWWIMGVSDRYIITYILGVGANGLYAVANKIPNILSIVNTIFFQAWQMSAIEEVNSRTKSQFYSNIFNVLATMLLLGTSFILLLLKIILHFVVSPVFFSAWIYVPFLLLGVVFSSFSGFLGTNYVAAKNTVGVFRTSVYGAVVNIVLNFLLIPLIGTNGASISTMLSFLAIWLLRVVDTKSFVVIKIDLKRLLINFVIIGLQIFIIYLKLSMENTLQAALFLTMILVNQKEIKLLVSKVSRLIRNIPLNRWGG